jgi:Zn-dependent M32 family carboxypeptidase
MRADTQDFDDVTKLCQKCYEEITSITQARYSTTWNLVYEAGRCHKGEAWVAATIMCRGALEATLHEAFAWEMRDGKLYLRTMLKYWRPNLERLIEWAKDVSLLADDQVKIAREIQREGNFAAHLKQKIDEELNKSKGRLAEKPYRLWTDEQTSWKLLTETVDLVIAIARRAFEIERTNPS